MAGWDQKTILVIFESSTFQTTLSQTPRRHAEVELCATKPRVWCSWLLPNACSC